MRGWLPMAMALLWACGDKGEDEGVPEPERVEGEETGDCSDGADNDADGDFDCDDAGCAASEDCQGPTDADGDGYATIDEGGLDCDDTDPAVHPDADERCNETDDDCDGDVDEDAVDAGTWYADADGDGYGDEGLPTVACTPPAAHVDQPGDCDDADDAVHPDAPEICNEADDDCDGETDEEPTDGDTWYTDADGDGFGDADSPVVACEQPEDALTDTSDCDDSDADIHPEAEEVCNEADDDCDGVTDGVLVPGDFAGIQEAIDGSSAGDLVCVDGGTWAETLDFGGKDLRVESLDGAEHTVIVGDGTGPVVAFSSGESMAATLRGFRLEGGAGEGAAVRIEGSGATLRELRIEGQVLTAEASLTGGFISVDEGELLLVDSVIADNELEVAPGGTDVEIIGGMVGLRRSSGTLQRVELSDNSVVASGSRAVAVHGVGVGVKGYEVMLDGVNISGHSGRAESSGGAQEVAGVGLWVGEDARVELAASRFVANEAACGSGGASCEVRGAGICLDGGGGELVDVDVVGNLADATATSSNGVYGGGLYVGGGLLEAVRLRLLDNDADSDGECFGGGAMLALGVQADANNVVVAGNRLGGHCDEGQGGGLYARPLHNTVAITNADFVGNVARGSSSARGGAIASFDYGDVALVNVGMVDNEASSGGSAEGAALHYEAAYALGALAVSYGNTHGNTGADAFGGVVDPTGSAGNLSVDPLYTDTSASDAASWDLSLGASSGCVDAGDPSIRDTDGSVSDIGAYGGPDGSW